MAVELWQAVRRLRWAAGFAALAIGILAVGIGTNAAMVALIDALLLRPPFHIADPENVVRVQFRLSGLRTHYPAFADLRGSGAFAAVAAHTDATVSIGAGEQARLVNALLVSHEFFHVLRPRPHLGSFAAGDANDEGEWAVISYGLWQRHFGGDASALGMKLVIDGRPYTVIAVTPKGFPSLSARTADVWLPLAHTPVDSRVPRSWRNNRERAWLSILARLADASVANVEARATSVLQSRQPPGPDDEYPGDVTITSIVPGRDARVPREYQVSFWLAGVSALLLLIACANVSNLVLTRALSQRREHFIRLALGASRRDLLRRHIADTIVIVVPGAVGAFGMSVLLRGAIAGFLPVDVPVSRDLSDLRTAAIVVGTAGLAFVLILSVSLLSLRTTWRGVSFAPVVTVRPVHRGTRRILLGMQAGVSLALLFVAGLFATSLRRAESLDLGAQLDRTLQLTIHLSPQHRLPGEPQAIHERAYDVLKNHPGVERVALTAGSPFKSGSGIGPRTAERTFQELWTNQPPAYRSVVGAGFFSTVGSLSLRGRDFSDDDRAGAPLVAIVNAPLARYLWPSREAIGECLWVDDEPACVRVIGVLGGVFKFFALERDRMALYVPLAQVPDSVPSALYVRPKTDARRFLPHALALVQSVRPDLPAARGVLLRDVVDPEFRPWRLGTTVFSAFAVVALVITAIGLYGVVTVSMMSRRKEIGIRMALGARWSHVTRVVAADSLASVGSGLVAGSVLATVASRWLGTVLYQTSPADPTVLLQTAGVLLLVSALAVLVPTLRALRTNPVTVLRVE